MSVHATALIDASARLGSGVSVGPYSVIGPMVEIGEGTAIGPQVVIHPFTRIGARCRIHAHAVLGDLPQDLAFREAISYTHIGQDVTIREGVTIHRGTKEGSVTEVGDGCYLMANSHLAHNVKLGRNVILANGVLLGGYVEVGERAFLSGNVGVHQFVRVGRLTMLGGGAGVSCDMPPFCMLRPGMVNRLIGLNTVGLRRNGIGAEERLALRAAFHLLFRSDLGLRAAVAEARSRFTDGPALELVEFVAGAKRGICKVDRRSTAATDDA